MLELSILKGVKMDFKTLIVKGINAKENPHKAVIPPIFLSSTFAQDSLDNFQKFGYSRGANPTKNALEELFAKVEGSKHCLSFGSGMAATATVFSLFKKGDKILLNSDIYGGTFRYATTVFQNQGIEYELIDNFNEISAQQIKGTTAIFIETPTNPMLNVIDIEKIAQMAKANNALLIVDNTFLTPYYQRPLDLGADIVVYSATKYIGGHSDVIAGLVTLNSDELMDKIFTARNTFGGIISPMDAYYLIRGLKTLSVRFDRQCENTHKIIKFLSQNPAVDRVHFAGSASTKEQEIQSKQAKDIGALISFELNKNYDFKKLTTEVKIFDLAASLGGVESLIAQPSSMTHDSYPQDLRDKIGIKPNLLRLAIGIEDANDLIADLDQAIKASKI